MRPLKLREQHFRGKRSPAEILPFARVLIDSPAFHLENSFDYIVTTAMQELATPGSLVCVPFGSALVSGVIESRHDQPRVTGAIREIEKVLSILPMITVKQIDLLYRVSTRYGCRPWDLLAAAISPFSKSGERAFISGSDLLAPMPTQINLPKNLQSFLHQSKLHGLINLPLSAGWQEILVGSIIARVRIGKVVVVLPDDRDLQSLLRDPRISELNPVNLSSNLKKSERYRASLRSNSVSTRLILGHRSAVFTSMEASDTLIVVNEVEEHHYEKRSPTWNSRDVALLRAGDCSLLFVSHSPSLELVRLVESGWLESLDISSSEIVRYQTLKENRDLTDQYFPIISEALKSGSVLIQVSNRGYINSFSCQKCRNLALCECGGRLFLNSKSLHPECASCHRIHLDWKCEWCEGTAMRTVAIGALRRGDEFGKSFPNTRVISSTSENPVVVLPAGICLVIATAGLEPEGSYKAVILLDGEAIFARTGLRSDEEGRYRWARALALIGAKGSAFISLPDSHFITQSFMKHSAIRSLTLQIPFRDQVQLPPNYRIAWIEGTQAEMVGAAKLLTENFGNESIQVFGPFPRKSGTAKLLLKSSVQAGNICVDKIRELNRVRSLQGKPLFRLCVDPFDIQE